MITKTAYLINPPDGCDQIEMESITDDEAFQRYGNERTRVVTYLLPNGERHAELLSPTTIRIDA